MFNLYLTTICGKLQVCWLCKISIIATKMLKENLQHISTSAKLTQSRLKASLATNVCASALFSSQAHVQTLNLVAIRQSNGSVKKKIKCNTCWRHKNASQVDFDKVTRTMWTALGICTDFWYFPFFLVGSYLNWQSMAFRRFGYKIPNKYLAHFCVKYEYKISNIWPQIVKSELLVY